MKTVFYFFLLFNVSLGFNYLSAQTRMTLDQAIKIALENNLSIQQSELNEKTAESNYLQSKAAYLPSINGNWSGTRNFGTTFDNVTFQRVQRTTDNSFTGIQGSITLFNGMTNHHTLHQNEYTVAAAQATTRKTENDVLTNVALTYLQLLFDSENIRISQDKIKIIQEQLDKREKEFNVGKITKTEILNLKSQIASEKLNLINQQNQLEKDKLKLAQELLLDPEINYQYDFPDTSGKQIQIPAETLSDILKEGLSRMPEIQEVDLKEKASFYGLRKARSGHYPTISLNGNFGSSYSSNGIFNPTTFKVEDTPYIDQLRQNQNQSISIQVSVPIFNRLTVRNQVRSANLSHQQSVFQQKVARNTLTQKIQQAYLDVVSAVNKYSAVQEQLISLKENFKMAQIRYDAGALDFFSFHETLNNQTKASSELLQAKYDFLFKRKILDLYLGKTLSF